MCDGGGRSGSASGMDGNISRRMGAGNAKNGFTGGVDQAIFFYFQIVSCHFAFGLY
jgi:hypothetical protein